MLKTAHALFDHQDKEDSLNQEFANYAWLQYAYGRAVGGNIYKATPWMRCMEYANEILAWIHGEEERNACYGLKYHRDAWEGSKPNDFRILIGHPKESVLMGMDWPLVRVLYTLYSGGDSLGQMWRSNAVPAEPPSHWKRPIYGMGEDAIDPNKKFSGFFAMSINPDTKIMHSSLRTALFLRLLRLCEWDYGPLAATKLREEPSYQNLAAFLEDANPGEQDKEWVREYGNNPTQIAANAERFKSLADDLLPDYDSMESLHEWGLCNMLEYGENYGERDSW